jgi:hypothetical protein
MDVVTVIRSLTLVVSLLLAFLQTASYAQTSDAPLLPVPLARDCTTLSPGAIFTGTQDAPYVYPWSLILKEWLRIGGPDSPIGCPQGRGVTDDSGSYVQFEHGQIAVSPGVWEQGVVAAYQDNLTSNGIIVDWTVSWYDCEPCKSPVFPSHYNYTKFVVRWDYNGQHFDNVDPKPCERGDGDQCDVLADMTEVQLFLLHYFHDTHLRKKGTFSIPVDHGNGQYRIAIEGCDEGTIGGSTCRQGFMHAVEVNFQAQNDVPPAPVNMGTVDFPVDLNTVPSANDVASSQDALLRRAAAITLHNACLPLLPYSAYRHEEDYTSIILAKLDYSNYYQDDICPGRAISNREEAFESLRNQQIDSRVGTTIDSCPGCRTGEYDVALSGYLPIAERFGAILPTDIYSHILNDLLDERGSLDLGDHSVSVGIPESENHINLIESARYLANDLLYTATSDSQYDNSSNSVIVFPAAFGYETEQVPANELGCSQGCSGISVTMRDYWLKRLRHFLQTDFIEYNARPYQGYSMRAIQNLASYAQDPQVRAAAGMVLDYVSAKFAASSNNNRRSAPYRRKAEYNDPYLIGFHADPQSARMLALVGDLDILKNTPKGDSSGHWYGRPDMEMSLVTGYRVPEPILDLIINPKHRIFYQGLHHYADELYAGSPSFLISAGGHFAPYAYTFLGHGNGDDIGQALPTTIMPTGLFISRTDLIRFELSGNGTYNMCVAPDFACGINPALPDIMNPQSMSYALKPGCVVSKGPWTFIDFSPSCRKDDTSTDGFYAALYQRSDHVSGSSGSLVSAGFVEVFDTLVNPNVTFNDFASHVIATNGNHHYHVFAKSNVYVSITGQTIDFELAPESRILTIVNGPMPAQSMTDMATGSVIQSSGRSGVITITNPYLGTQLTLDDSDPYNPTEYLAAFPRLGADTCLTGFQWRLADPSDHVCVTSAQRHQTQAENNIAHAHTLPHTVDTCKHNYVWRLADATDHVCVSSNSYEEAQWDNKLAPSRLAAPLP